MLFNLLLLSGVLSSPPTLIEGPTSKEQLDVPCPPMELIYHPYWVANPEGRPNPDQILIQGGCAQNFGAESRCALHAVIQRTGHISVVCGAPSGVDDPDMKKTLDELRAIMLEQQKLVDELKKK